MDLPSPSDLNECNRLVVMAAQLAGPDVTCSAKHLVTLCSSFVFAGRPADHWRTLKLCRHAKLVSVNKNRVRLTELGKEFLRCNPDSVYEITEKQKGFVAEHLILTGPWQSRARAFFLCFSPNYYKITYELDVEDNRLPMSHNWILHLLLRLGVLLRTDDQLIVEPKYVPLVRKLRADKTKLSQEELDGALQLHRKVAEQAEDAVVEYERERLRSIGRNLEASLVRRVSQLDATAGYDIESFDGDKPLVDYDRFIEVKTSYENKLRFFWSANECRVAEEKGEKYWIYFVGGFYGTHTGQISPIMIRHPTKRLEEMREVNIRVATYLIEQSNEFNT